MLNIDFTLIGSLFFLQLFGCKSYQTILVLSNCQQIMVLVPYMLSCIASDKIPFKLSLL